MANRRLGVHLLALIVQACLGGARLHKACAVLGLAARTVQRWLQPGAAAGDRRTSDQRAANAARPGPQVRRCRAASRRGHLVQPRLQGPAAQPDRAALG
jgi:hypothetical protein